MTADFIDANKLLFSRYEAAQMLSISDKAVDRAIHSGRLKPTRIGRRVLIHRSDLAAFARL